MQSHTDEAVAMAVQNGDIEAFGELVCRYESKMQRYARKFLSCREDIDDVVQEVFIKAYMNIQSFDTSLRFSPWLYRIAHNSFVNELKKKYRFRFDLFDPDILLPHFPAKETADAAALELELRKEMEQHIEELSPKYREVIILYYFESFSYQEISDILQIPVTTVGVRLQRAKNSLKKLLQSHHE